ncbi:MAG: hypothetical protein M1826_001268 [Phylliscum demangeonii]|nr:MAG: hypothetical protein M1826_001268 [Phylliscum demangeonii]
MLTFALVALLLAPQVLSAAAPKPKYFQITAIGAVNRKSRLQCWQLSTPFFVSNATTEDLVGADFEFLGPMDNATYGVVPANYESAAHRDHVEYLAVLSGLAQITIPGTAQSVAVGPGGTDFIIAADTSAVSDTGHATAYPSSNKTTVLAVQPKGGAVPDHTVVHDGPCKVA